MAEEQKELNMNDKSVVLEDTDDSDKVSDVDLNSSSIIDHVMERFKKSDDYREQDEQSGYEPIEIIEVFMDLMYNLQKLKSLGYLLKQLKQKHLQPMVRL